MDEKYLPELPSTVPKWVKDGALKMYCDYKARGIPIPESLQRYIDNGIKRELNGMKAFPVSRSSKQNPIVVWMGVSGLIKINGLTEKQAIERAAALFKITEKQTTNIYRKFEGKTCDEIIYYLIPYW